MRMVMLVLWTWLSSCIVMFAQDANWMYTTEVRVQTLEAKVDSLDKKFSQLIERLDRPKRVQIGGLFYDVSADGKVKECEECNAPVRAARAVPQPQPIVYRLPAQEVPAQSYFPGRVQQSSQSHPHECPRCHYTSPERTGTWVVQRMDPDGHWHTCPKCGQSWKH